MTTQTSTKPGTATSEKLKADLECNEAVGAQARELLARRYGRSIGSEAMENLKLVTSELVNNAYLHGEGAITLRVDLGADTVRVEVIDQGAGVTPEIGEKRRPGEGGLGLRIVDRLASRWGAYEGSTHVWAELSIS